MMGRPDEERLQYSGSVMHGEIRQDSVDLTVFV